MKNAVKLTVCIIIIVLPTCFANCPKGRTCKTLEDNSAATWNFTDCKISSDDRFYMGKGDSGVGGGERKWLYGEWFWVGGVLASVRAGEGVWERSLC